MEISLTKIYILSFGSFEVFIGFCRSEELKEKHFIRSSAMTLCGQVLVK